MAFCKHAHRTAQDHVYGGRVIEVEYDTRDIRGGDKTWQWIKKGVPIRLEIGPRDVAEGSVFMARRDKGPKEKESVKMEDFVARVADILQEIQDGLLAKAKAFRKEHTRVIDTKEAFYDFFTAPETGENQPTPIHGGFALAHFNGDPALEEQIKNDLAVTVRCIPLDGQDLCDDDGRPGTCPFTGVAEGPSRGLGEELLVTPREARRSGHDSPAGRDEERWPRRA